MPSQIPTKLPPPVEEPDSDDDEPLVPVRKRSADEAGLKDDPAGKKAKVGGEGVIELNDDEDDIIILD